MLTVILHDKRMRGMAFACIKFLIILWRRLYGAKASIIPAASSLLTPNLLLKLCSSLHSGTPPGQHPIHPLSPGRLLATLLLIFVEQYLRGLLLLY